MGSNLSSALRYAPPPQSLSCARPILEKERESTSVLTVSRADGGSGILAKKTMGGGVGENMTEVSQHSRPFGVTSDGPMMCGARRWQANLYAVLTIIAFIFILPISFAMEPPAAIMGAMYAA